MNGAVAQEILEADIVRVAPQGRLDTFSVPPFEQVLTEHLDAGRARLIVDLAGVTYVSSSGLRALLSARRRARLAGGDVVLCSMAPRVREIFEMVGFISLFNVYPTAEEAIRSVREGIPPRA
ncbi:MAG TPA: STAS domain-containing protein [Anaerolineae bacterium]|nr:STAS domain-containing protein [Anaerolineae bacterium]